MTLMAAQRRVGDFTPGGSIAQPFFLVACERSGTTMTSLMLSHHRDLEFNDFYFTVEMIPEEGGWPDLDAYHSYLETDWIFQASGLTVDRSLDYPQLVNSFLHQKLVESGKPIVGGKIRQHYHRLLRVWPDARFIHLLRDGRDVARSIIGMGWAGNMFTAGEYWLEAERNWDRLCTLVPEDRRFEIRYEDLVSIPERILKGVCEFLRVPFDPAMLEYPKDSTYDSPSRELAGQWHRKLSREAVRMAESLMGDMLMRRGYELSGYPSMEIDPAVERRLRRQDKLYRARVRLKRFGFPLYAADYITRRLGPSSLQKLVKKRMNAIERRHLK